MNRKNVTRILITLLLITSIITPAAAEDKGKKKATGKIKVVNAPGGMPGAMPSKRSRRPRRRGPGRGGIMRGMPGIPGMGIKGFPSMYGGRGGRGMARTTKYVTLAESPEDRKIRAALQKKIDELDFPDIAFSDVIDYLREKFGVNLYVNWRALEAAGIDKTQTVSIKMKDVTFQGALQVILNDVGGGATELAYAVHNGILKISTREDIGMVHILTVYDVRDMVDWNEREAMGHFMKVIQFSVGRDARNQPPAIIDTNGLLVVRASSQQHDEIKNLLARLRQAPPPAGAKRAISQRTRAKEARTQIKLVGNLKETCFDPNAMGLIALGAISREFPRSPKETIQELETLLARTKTLGLRNAIRLTLKDLYKETNQPAKAMELMRALFDENDSPLGSSAFDDEDDDDKKRR